MPLKVGINFGFFEYPYAPWPSVNALDFAKTYFWIGINGAVIVPTDADGYPTGALPSSLAESYSIASVVSTLVSTGVYSTVVTLTADHTICPSATSYQVEVAGHATIPVGFYNLRTTGWGSASIAITTAADYTDAAAGGTVYQIKDSTNYRYKPVGPLSFEGTQALHHPTGTYSLYYEGTAGMRYTGDITKTLTLAMSGEWQTASLATATTNGVAMYFDQTGQYIDQKKLALIFPDSCASYTYPADTMKNRWLASSGANTDYIQRFHPEFLRLVGNLALDGSRWMHPQKMNGGRSMPALWADRTAIAAVTPFSGVEHYDRKFCYAYTVDVTDADLGNCVAFTVAGHGWVTGESLFVVISNAAKPGTAHYDAVTVVDENTLRMPMPKATAVACAITSSGTVATVTKSAHGYLVGYEVTIAGATQAEYNGTYVITSKDTNTFTYTFAGSETTPATGSPTCRGPGWISIAGDDPCVILQKQINSGIAIELIVAFANYAYTTWGHSWLWVHVRYDASDAYITAFLTYLKDNLNAAIQIYLECDNETWNTANGYQCQSTAMKLKAIANGLTTSSHGHGVRTREVSPLIDTVFGAAKTRVLRVLGVQTAGPQTSVDAIAGATVDGVTKADVLGVASYYTVGIAAPADIAEIDTAARANMAERITNITHHGVHAAAATSDRSAALTLACYEGLTMAADGQTHANYAAQQADSTCYTLVRDYIDDLTAAGVLIVNVFEFMRPAAVTPPQYFGVYQWMDDAALTQTGQALHNYGTPPATATAATPAAGTTIVMTFTEADVPIVASQTFTDYTIEGTTNALTVTSAVVSSNTTLTLGYSGGVIYNSATDTPTVTIAAGAITDSSTTPVANAAITDYLVTNSSTQTYDTPPLTVTVEQAAAQVSPTATSPINFTVTFSSAVTDFATGDVAFTGSTAAGTLVGTVSGSGTVYNVAVAGMSGSGTVVVTLIAGVAHDSGANANEASTSTDNTVTYDVTVPTCTINKNAGQNDPTNDTTINFTLIFSKAVVDLAVGDITLSGTAGATTVVLTGSGTSYNVAVSGMTQSGTVIASMAAGVVADALGNTNAASTSTDNTVEWVGLTAVGFITQSQSIGICFGVDL